MSCLSLSLYLPSDILCFVSHSLLRVQFRQPKPSTELQQDILTKVTALHPSEVLGNVKNGLTGYVLA
jgi:hypothetical protein